MPKRKYLFKRGTTVVCTTDCVFVKRGAIGTVIEHSISPYVLWHSFDMLTANIERYRLTQCVDQTKLMIL